LSIFCCKGNVYIADRGNSRIRKVNAVTGIITTFAGTGTCGSSGDNGEATSATLCNPEGVGVDYLGNFIYYLTGAFFLTKSIIGNVYIADLGNSIIRKVTVTTNPLVSPR
jgi:hypothetical protein